MALFQRELPRLRLGTRGSRLALIQAQMVRDHLSVAHPGLSDRIEVVTFSTSGDERRNCTLEALNVAQGGRGAFSDDIDAAVLNGTIDFAVHSVKDTPPDFDSRLVLAATLERADPREAFVSFRHAALVDVPEDAIFGSASLRREALLRAIYPVAAFTLLRGNVEDRVAAVQKRDLDGTILAVAGLMRLGLATVITEVMPPEVLMPDPGQGTVGIVCATDNLRLRRLLTAVDHHATHAAIDAERAALSAIGSALPVGALATLRDDHLILDAVAALTPGAALIRGRIDGPVSHAVSLGRVLGLQLKTGMAAQAAA